MGEDVPAPAIFSSLPGVPNSLLGALHALDELDGVAPRQSCNNLLHDSRSGNASANALIYFRFRGESPVISGKSRRRSAARRSMTRAPQPAAVCLSRISRPMLQ